MKNLSWNQIQPFSPNEPLPPQYQPLTGLTPVVLVGLTGVGKTTVLKLLTERNLPFSLLPNRRELTDKVIITSLQREDGQEPHPIADRLARFEYTARYRAKFPGGMAHALSRLAIDSSQAHDLLVFDGLRGLDEVQQATVYFPRARFVVLDAPDIVRLQRLLDRDDAFDTVVNQPISVNAGLLSALREVPDIETVFSQEQLQQLVNTTELTQLSRAEVIQKVSIIVTERRNYDSGAARKFLSQQLPPHRVLIVDTAAHPAQVVAGQVADWLKIELRGKKHRVSG